MPAGRDDDVLAALPDIGHGRRLPAGGEAAFYRGAIAREVVAGQECGMAFEGYQDMKAGDVIECYRVETIQRSL